MTRSPRRLREQVKDTVSDLPIHAARLAVMGVGRALLLTDRVRKDYRDVRETGLGPVLGRLKNDAENITGMVVGKVAGNGKAEEEPKSRAAGDSEISLGKPKSAAPSRPASTQRPATPPKPATAPPSRPAEASRPKPATTSKPAASKPAASKPAAKPAAKPASKPAAKPAASKPASKPATSNATASKAPESKATESKATEAKPKPAPKPKPAAQAKPSTPAKPAARSKAAESKPATQAKASTPAKASAKPAARAKGGTAKDLPVSGYDEATLASVRARLRGLDAKQVTELRDYERSHGARADFLRMYENRIAKLRGEH